jgi:DNA polymerase-3 subunit gamma/tau
VALLGVTDSALLDEMCDALAAGDGAAAYGTIDRVAEAGHDPRRFASDLLERMRDLIVLQQVPDAVAKGLIDGPADQMERMAAQAERLGPATLSRSADIVHNGLVEMRGTTAPRLLLELVTARMLLPGAEDSTGALLQRLERMERRFTLTGAEAPPAAVGSTPAEVRPAPVPAPSQPPAAPPPPQAAPPPPTPVAHAAPVAQAAPRAVASARPATPQPVRRTVPSEAVMPDPATPEPAPPGPAAVPGELDAVAVRRAWDEVLGMVSRKSKRAAAVVREATVRDIDGQTLVLTFRHSVHANMLSGSPELLLEAIYEVLGVRWQIRCEVAGDQRGSAPSAPARSAPGPAEPARPTPAPAERSAAPAPVRSAGESDWPEPARPGGAAPAATPVAESEAWPTPATPGGVATAPAADNGVSNGNGSGNGNDGGAGSANGAAGGGSRPAQGNGAPSPGLAAARAAAAGRGARTPAKGAEGAWPDGTVPDEPPYDPEYDGAPKPAAANYEGFDPGDEPLDQVIDEKTARQTSEQQAMQLLQQALGAE